MWFCTDKGVSRYDGYDFVTYDINDGLPSNISWDIIVDKDGQGVWVASFLDKPVEI